VHILMAKLIGAFHSFANVLINDRLRIFPNVRAKFPENLYRGSKVSTEGVGGGAMHSMNRLQ
jgi:hypothetical protein